MSRVKAQISISLDGCIAGPNQSEEHPLGEGGEDLHEWVIKLTSWRDAHGREGGEDNPSDAVIKAAQEDTGAVVMGRNMFGPVRGPWTEPAWTGWWGDDPPFHTPVFVLTHHEREPLQMEGDTTFFFVTGGVENAIVQAKEAAGDLDVSIGGGADTIQQAIAAGLLDELLLNQVPIVLGDGRHLLENLGEPAPKFALTQVIEGPEAAHLYYRVG
jgi:dihydrofolate reductase